MKERKSGVETRSSKCTPLITGIEISKSALFYIFCFSSRRHFQAYSIAFRFKSGMPWQLRAEDRVKASLFSYADPNWQSYVPFPSTREGSY